MASAPRHEPRAGVAAPMTRIAIFAYGSLVDAASAARTLRSPAPDPIPARLEGWRRRWSVARDNIASEKTFACDPDERVPRHVLGLNLEPSNDGPGANGVLLEVAADTLLLLDNREIRYRRVDMTDAVDVDGFDEVHAYVAHPDHRAPTPPPDSVVIAAYHRIVERAFAALGPEQHRLYTATTDPPPVEVVEAVLIRDGIPDGNPREW